MPIPIEQRITALLLSLLLLALTVQLIRRHKLREEYALIWLGASGVIFLFSLFGGLVGRLARLFDVAYPPTLILSFGLFFALMVLLSQTVALSAQANRIRDLAQSHALLEWRLRQLEQNAEPTRPERMLGETA